MGSPNGIYDDSADAGATAKVTPSMTSATTASSSPMWIDPNASLLPVPDNDDYDDNGNAGGGGGGNHHENFDDPNNDPVSLEGTLLYRKGKATGHASLLWKWRFVTLSFADGGSIIVYKTDHLTAVSARNGGGSALRSMYSKLHRSMSTVNSFSNKVSLLDGTTGAEHHATQIDVYIPSHVPWIVRDVENDPAQFVLEVDTHSDLPPDDDESCSVASSAIASSWAGTERRIDNNDEPSTPKKTNATGTGGSIVMNSLPVHAQDHLNTPTAMPSIYEDEVFQQELEHAKRKGKPLRLYFKCDKGSNEKALWLKACSKLGRFCRDPRQKRSLLSLVNPLWPIVHYQDRVRTAVNENFARDTRQLERDELLHTMSSNMHLANDVEQLARGTLTRPTNAITNASGNPQPQNGGVGKAKEYRVLPSYAYPHRWMTRQEMREEMVLPSTDFCDLRLPYESNSNKKEIGTLKIEVLQCLGLPKLDRTSHTDAVVYLVCGSYAFSTDVIPNRANPMWLRKSRRGCIFPLFHGYARLYVGVFDDDGKRVKDEFAGRVVVDLARLRPDSTYDVTLPLRLSTHVYSRRRRGAIRLRFTLSWNSEREALWSYLPRTLRIPLPQNSRPNTSVTVACADDKAFRNIAITVHGAHLPGRFTFQQMRAAIREINFTRKYLFTSIRQEIRETRQWYYPAVSSFVFLSWMHCVYANSFALVPAYVVLYFLLQLLRNYVRHGLDGPAQRGFVPPSWEEMMLALIKGGEPGNRAVEPLELGLRPMSLSRSHTGDTNVSSANQEGEMEHLDYKVATHKPKGKPFFRAVGFLPEPSVEIMTVDESHLEFPFANGVDYPKFTVKECMVGKKGDVAKPEAVAANAESTSVDGMSTYQITTTNTGDVRIIPRWPPEMEMPSIMRKDSSGLRETDEEEANFFPRHAVVHTGKTAAHHLTNAAYGVTQQTGLHYLVDPIRTGINTTVDRGIHGVAGVGQGMTNIWENGGYIMRRAQSTDSEMTEAISLESSRIPISLAEHVQEANSKYPPNFVETDDDVDPDPVDTSLLWPEQNIDIEGPSTGKKLTDDLAEIKDKMHELTWHLFDDQVYKLAKDNVYFGDVKKSEKRRKDVPRQLDKLLGTGQYSHSNPFVARVGLYVEPIIGSVYSFLCVFRALFNVYTWQDPMLSFWLSVFCAIVAFVLFIFPWRIFLFGLGVMLVGPQNWVIRVLRERGHLPPMLTRGPTKIEEEEIDGTQPVIDQPVFSCHKTTDVAKTSEKLDVDPREIHRVVIPYSPLVHQRFYDWPPEPQYAQVKRVRKFDDAKSTIASLLQSRAGQSQSQRRGGPLRRPRFRRTRSGASSSGGSTFGHEKNAGNYSNLRSRLTNLLPGGSGNNSDAASSHRSRTRGRAGSYDSSLSPGSTKED